MSIGMRTALRAGLPWTIVFSGLLMAAVTRASDVPVTPKKLIVLDRTQIDGSAKVVFTAKDPAVTKGSGTNLEDVDVTFRVAHPSSSPLSYFELVVPAGSASGWVQNDTAAAKFVNPSAPGGAAQTKIVVVKPGSLLKLRAKGLGEEFNLIDVTSNTASTALCVRNGAEETCHCSLFSDCAWRGLRGGRGYKIVCRTGTGDPDCLAAATTTTSTTTSTTTTTTAPVCGNDLTEPGEECDGTSLAFCVGVGVDGCGSSGGPFPCQCCLQPGSSVFVTLPVSIPCCGGGFCEMSGPPTQCGCPAS